MSDIFISYSRVDRACAHELVALLEAQGLRCWIAPRDICPSADWAAEIIDAITAARVMVLVFSASSNQSPQVRREVERAVHKGVNVLPFRIDDVAPSKSLEFFLSAQHWMDAFPPPREPHYHKLSNYLRTQLAAPAPSAAPSTPPSGVGATIVPAREAVAAGEGAFSSRDLAHIEAQLASYIGPLAKYLVKREAQRSAGSDELIARLSTELEAESDRATFAQRCRSLRSAH
ncbi:MAG: toll/interleukin-1 receptor domain-containing protein [Steroidobacteraceae bacterium]